MAAANCSPALASRRAKYVDEFWVPTLLGAQPRSQNFILAADAQLFSDGSSRLYSAVTERRLAPVTATTQIPEFSF
jgi:hypothetical protein